MPDFYWSALIPARIPRSWGQGCEIDELLASLHSWQQDSPEEVTRATSGRARGLDVGRLLHRMTMTTTGLSGNRPPAHTYVRPQSLDSTRSYCHVVVAMDPYGDDFPLLRDGRSTNDEVEPDRDGFVIVTFPIEQPDECDPPLGQSYLTEPMRRDINRELAALDLPVSIDVSGWVLNAAQGDVAKDSRGAGDRPSTIPVRTFRKQGIVEHWARVLMTLAVYRQDQAIEKIEGCLREAAARQRPRQLGPYRHGGTDVKEVLPLLATVGDGFSRLRCSLWFTAVPGWTGGSAFLTQSQSELHLDGRIQQIQDNLEGWALALQIEYGELQREAQERADRWRDKLQQLAAAIALPGLIFAGAALVVDSGEFNPWHLVPFVLALAVAAIGWVVARPKSTPAAASDAWGGAATPSPLLRTGGGAALISGGHHEEEHARGPGRWNHVGHTRQSRSRRRTGAAGTSR